MTAIPTPTPADLDRERERFRELEARLPDVWRLIESRQPFDHTSVVVPSLSFHREELAKIEGVPFYEERLLFSLIRLRHPRARVVYVTSQPIHPDIVDYYLQHLVGVPASHARERLKMCCVYDASPRPLSEKLLERPRLLERIRGWVGDPERAYLTCFNSTALERRLAVELGIPLNGLDPELLHLGTKSGCRKLFRAAGVPLPEGFEDLHGRDEVVEALAELADRRPGLRRAVIKLDESFAGAGNAIYRFPSPLPDDPVARRRALDAALDAMSWSAGSETVDAFLRKMGEMGGIAEEMLEAEEVQSPSVQMRITPLGEVELISTHDQVLAGSTGQSYVGCRFPAARAYRSLILAEAVKVGAALRDQGVVSRFAIDFLVSREAGGPWSVAAIEINLRMGGTTPPFLALQFLTGGSVMEDGHFESPRGQDKFYYATDYLSSPAYCGLLPDDFIDILTLHGLCFRPSTETGVLFHMIGGLSQYGKVGVTCIGDSREEADSLYQRTVDILDQATGVGGAEPAMRGHLEPMFEAGVGRME